MTKVKQVMLSHNPEHGQTETLTTWLDDRPDLRAGAKVMLKDFKPAVEWTVRYVFEGTHQSSSFDFHRQWDNNDYSKHEGLDV